MLFYDATVRPAGQLTHEVPRSGLSAAEVYMLRYIHGDDGVVRLNKSKVDRKVVDAEERARLKHVYGEKHFAAVFGSTFGSKLPDDVPEQWMEGAVAQEPVEEPDWARAHAG